MTPEAFFANAPDSMRLFKAVQEAIASVGAAEIRATKSQIAFHRRRPFAWVWMPGMYLKRRAAPLVLTVALRRRDESTRWKQIVEPVPGRFTHHMEVYDEADVDDEVVAWLREAWQDAG